MDNYDLNQQTACEYINKMISKNRLSHAYIIEANNYKKKNDFAYSFAKLLSSESMNIDIIKPDGMWIKKEQIEKLQKDFTRKSILGNNKVYIIEDADKLNKNSANTLLKFLEEPEENIIAILVVDNLYQVLPTIKSRCQIITLTNSDKINDENNDIDKEKDYINFLVNIEKRKKDIILYENVMFLNKYKTKEYILDFINFSLNFYKNVMEYILDNDTKDFNQFENDIKIISEYNDLIKICDKINILNEKKEHLKVNENLNLLIDDIIINFSEV